MSDEKYPHFSVSELASPDTGHHEMNPDFMQLVETLREEYGWPMKVSSGYRTPAHNDAVSTTGLHGPHTTGKAIDIVVSGTRALYLVQLATALGFSGIGVKQSGDHARRFIHLDNLANDETSGPRPWIWSYA